MQQELRVIHQGPMEFGGEEVTTGLPEGYEGPCRVVSDGIIDEKLIGAFPTFQEATRAACYAITPSGGYGSVIVEACEASEITHLSMDDWAY